MLTQSLHATNALALQRNEAQDEAARLKAEILQRGDELAKLERLAGSVSTSRHATQYDIWPRPSSGLVSPNGSRSASTGRIIEQLQREIDHLKRDSQAAVQNYESERRAREALRIKCDDLEIHLGGLRAQSQAHTHSLERSDRALSAARSTTQTLQTSLLNTSEERNQLDRTLASKDELIASLQARLHREQGVREKTEAEYQTLLTSHLAMQKELFRQMKQMRQEVDALRVASHEDLLQTRTAKEDIILFNEQQRVADSSLAKSREMLDVRRQAQHTLVHQQIQQVAKELETLTHCQQRDESGINDIKRQLEALARSVCKAEVDRAAGVETP